MMSLGINEKAWAGFNIVVFGKTPLTPMKMEQAIAKASPANETKIDSFEDFDQAYDFCKEQKNVGLIFISENSGEASASDVFKSLATHYETKGWPCFGVLVAENEKTFNGYIAIQKNQNLIGYYFADEILNPDKTFSTLNSVWEAFVGAFENHILPERLQDTFLSMVCNTIPQDTHDFHTRTATLLCQNLNLSWLETVAVRWQPVISALATHFPDAIKPNGSLIKICELAAIGDESLSLLDTVKSQSPLPSRVNHAIRLLDKARLAGGIADSLAALETHSRPGAPALLRRIAKTKTEILEIAASYHASENVKKSG